MVQMQRWHDFPRKLEDLLGPVPKNLRQEQVGPRRPLLYYLRQLGMAHWAGRPARAAVKRVGRAKRRELGDELAQWIEQTRDAKAVHYRSKAAMPEPLRKTIAVIEAIGCVTARTNVNPGADS